MAELYLGHQKITPILKGVDGFASRVGANANGEFEYKTTDFVMPSSVKTIKGESMRYAFYGDKSIKTVNFNKVSAISGVNACANTFQNCTSLEYVDMSSVKDIYGNNNAANAMFSGCTNLKYVDLSSLERLSATTTFANGFLNCTSLESMEFPSLWYLFGHLCLQNLFKGCTNLKEVRFPALADMNKGTNQFNSMLSGVTGCTVHFPAAMREYISSLADALAGFGGTDTVILFDL